MVILGIQRDLDIGIRNRSVTHKSRGISLNIGTLTQSLFWASRGVPSKLFMSVLLQQRLEIGKNEVFSYTSRGA